MAFLWGVSFLILWKGVKSMGKASFITTPVPYLIVGAFFIRSLFLDGMEIGLYAYLVPNFDKLADLSTWRAALYQCCMSLTVGYGGLHTMASYNRPDHNSFRDAWIVVLADSLMSIIGGSAVYATLGHLSYATQIPLDQLDVTGKFEARC
ncbi:unnamed protein product, partial [Mesorhabditis spiculigera]